MKRNAINKPNPTHASFSTADALLVQMEAMNLGENERADIVTINQANNSASTAIPRKSSAAGLPRSSSYGRAFQMSNSPNAQSRSFPENENELKQYVRPSSPMNFPTSENPRSLGVGYFMHIPARIPLSPVRTALHSGVVKDIKKLRTRQEVQSYRKSVRQRIISDLAASEARKRQGQDQLSAKRKKKIGFNDEVKINYPSTNYLDFESSGESEKTLRMRKKQ